MPSKLSREQARVLREANRLQQGFAISVMTLLELALLFDDGRLWGGISLDSVLNEIDSNPDFQILPITVEIAAEVGALGPSLRDPGDRAIVATARVHRLKLVTSDQRIIDSGLVAVVA